MLPEELERLLDSEIMPFERAIYREEGGEAEDDRRRGSLRKKRGMDFALLRIC
jgi:hypothetical protein